MKKLFLLSIGISFIFAACSSSTTTRDPLKTFGGCNEIQALVSAPRAGTLSSDTVALSGTSEGSAQPNLQEKGVDESDIVRVNSSQIFVARNRSVEVVQRRTLKQVGTLSLENLRRPELFTDAERLIVLGSTNTGSFEVRVYQTHTGKMPELVKASTYVGWYSDSRLVNGHLVVVATDSSFLAYDSKGSPSVKLDSPNSISGISCECIHVPPTTQNGFALTKILSLNIQTSDVPEKAIGFLGGGNHVYMAPKNLYVTANIWGETSETQISKVAFIPETGDVVLTAIGKVAGFIKDRWALKEYAEGLAVATTVGGWQTQANRLSLMAQSDVSLNVVASTADFGNNEDIRAIRYVGATAYVVTFEKTDPLFAIDMSNPLKPNILGELVIPGFSTQLHPLTKDRVFGVGFDAKDVGDFSWFQGVQFSLYDVHDPLHLNRLDNKILGMRGSYSDATSDSHAFYYDPQRNRVGVPIVDLTGTPKSEWDYGTELRFSGAILYEAKDSLKEKARLSHSRFIPEECKKTMAQGRWWQSGERSFDINRMMSLDGELLTISRFGVIAHCDDAPATENRSIRFPVGGAIESEICTPPAIFCD